MFLQVFFFELRYWLSKPPTYIYSAVFGGLLLFIVLGTAGYFDGPTDTVSDQIPRWLNSAYEINYLLGYFNKFFLFLLPAIIGVTIFRDFQNGASKLMYSFPIHKSQYLTAKFFSSFSVVIGITFFALICMMMANIILSPENINIGPFNLWGYLKPYFFILGINLLIYGMLVFLVVALFRNIYAGFVLVMVLLLIQIIVENLFSSNPFLIALLDPFGQNSVMYETASWTQSERNSKQLPFMEMVLYNRLVWLGIISTLAFYLYRKFTFSQDALFAEQFSGRVQSSTKGIISSNKLQISPIHIDFSLKNQLAAMWAIARFNFVYILNNWIFIIFTGFGILAILFAIGKATNFNEIALLPLTRLVLNIPLIFFSSIITIITFVFSGMIIHRNKSVGINELEDSSPTGNMLFLGGKLLALIFIQVFSLVVMMICGIAIQIYNEYYHFEFGLYLKYIFAISLPPLIIWACLCMLAHTIFRNVYLGIFLLILVWMGKDQLSLIGINTHLIAFNHTNPLNYSDINGFGHGILAYMVILGYWMSWSIIFLMMASILWNRGYYFSRSEYLGRIKRQLGRLHIFTFLIGCAAFLSFGYKILKEEKKLIYNKKNDSVMVDFKAEFEVFKHLAQPSIVAIDLNLDLFPKSNQFHAIGKYQLINNHLFSLDTLLVKTGYDEKTEFNLNREYKIIKENTSLKYRALLLNEPLMPGDTILLNFSVTSEQNTILERNSGVLANGTFLRHDILPRLGYFFNDNPPMPMDEGVSSKNFYAPDADYLSLSTIISTSEDQTAMAPGKLLQSWNEKGRNYFQYHTEENIKLAFAFMSGKYALKESAYEDKQINVFYHPTHYHNIDGIELGIQKALEYNSLNFSSYQHKDVNVVEFPLSEGTIATLMGNVMPISEQKFVLNQKEGLNNIDLSFYIPAHELTHHWWGNQIIPADALGAKMLTESITEYVTLQIYKANFGTNKSLQFLQAQHQRYHRGRTRESKEENPLWLVGPDQDYISYGKGAVAFNTISHYMGEENFNLILKSFLIEFLFKNGFYPTSLDFINHLKERVPAIYHYIIDDYFLSISFYENEIKKIELSEMEEGYQVQVEYKINKKQNDATISAPLMDFVEIGFVNVSGDVLYVEKILVSQENNTLNLNLKERPKSVILDPNLLMIDKNRSKYEMEF